MICVSQETIRERNAPSVKSPLLHLLSAQLAAPCHAPGTVRGEVGREARGIEGGREEGWINEAGVDRKSAV